MPLARIKLRNEFRLGDPELYRGAAVGKEGPKAILDGVAVAGIVGILRQLGDVAEFGAQIFHDLHEQVMTTSARGNKMLSRIRKIEETLPSIEDTINGKESFIDLAYETGSDWRSKIKIIDSHLSYSDFPQFMMDSYEECRDPPRLHLLDKYDRAGTGACLKRYSDPSYFKRVWEISELEKAHQIQKGKKLKKIKRKYSRHMAGEVQNPVSTSQCKSLATSARSPSLFSNEDQSFSAENSSIPEIRLKAEVTCGPQLLKNMKKLDFTGQVSESKPSVLPNDLEYDRLSFSNVQNNQVHPNVSKIYSNEFVFRMDDDSPYNFMHRKSTSGSPSVIWDEKPELMKPTDHKFSNDTLQDLKLLLVNSESSKAKEPARNGSLEKTKPLPIISDMPRSSCEQKQFEEVTEVDCYMDALNTLESEAETDSECQTKCIQSLPNKGHQKNDSGFAMIPKKYINYSSEDPLELLDSSNNCVLPRDANLDVSGALELKQSTQEAVLSPGLHYDGSCLSVNNVVTMSRTNAFQEIDDDQPPWSNEVILETTETISQIHISPPNIISNIPSIRLWTNGNILGLQPSKPPDVCFPNGAGEGTEPNSLSTGMKLDKENMVNGQRSQHMNSNDKVECPPESLSLANQRTLNSNQFLSRNCVEENNSMNRSSTYLDCHYDGFCAKQDSQEQSEAFKFSQQEGSQVASPNILPTCNSQVHQTTSIASSMETGPYREFNVASPSMDSLHNSKCLSPSFYRLPQRNLVQGLQIKQSFIHAKNSIQYDPNVYTSQSEGNLVDTGVASQTFYEHNLAFQTSDKPNLMNKTNYGLLEKSISSCSHHSQNSSPPLEHMNISFHPMNVQSNLKLEVPDGCLSHKIDGNVFPLFQLFPGCAIPAQDGGSESDLDTFCRSYQYSTDDLLSPYSDSNSDLWEQDDCSVSKINEMSDDLPRTSSSKASISSYSGFDPINHVAQDIGLNDICAGNDAVPFQPGFIANIPSLESLINNVKYDSLSISPKNAATLAPTELPPPPPLPPIKWILLRPSYEISEDNYSNISQLVNHFDGPLNTNLSALTENESIVRSPTPVGEDGEYKKMQDQPKMDRHLQANLSSTSFELDRREQLLHQIRDMDIQHKLKPCEESKIQVATCNGVEESNLLHQIRTKTFNLRRTSTSRPLVTAPATNDKITAILEKANAIRQACASSEEADNSDEWSDA